MKLALVGPEGMVLFLRAGNTTVESYLPSNELMLLAKERSLPETSWLEEECAEEFDEFGWSSLAPSRVVLAC